MKSLISWHKWGIVALLCLFTSCLFETKDETPSVNGYLHLDLSLKPNQLPLLKKSSMDTMFTLDTLKIILSTSDIAPVTYTYPISGRSDTGNIVVTAKTYSLSSLRTWKAKIIVLDTTFNPAKTDTVYNDSLTFIINPGDTNFVTRKADPTFSILRARYISNSPASLTNFVKYIRLRVDGTLRDSLAIGPTLRGMSFGSNNTGIAIGDSGLILRTTNSSVNWAVVTSGITQNLNDAHCPSTNTCYAAGNGGTVIKTTTGTSWSSQTTNTARNLIGIHFSGTSAGYVVGDSGTIKISNGTTWTSATTTGTTKNLNSVFAPSGTVGFAVGANGTIVKTSNSGVNWSALTSNTTKNLNAVYFRSTTLGFAVGDSGVILKTSDGSTWSALTSNTTKDLTGIFFTSNTVGYIVGDAGILLRTTDATAWTTISTSTTQDLNAVWWSSNGSVGTAVGTASMILKSANGTTWTNNSFGTKSFDMLLTYKYLKPNVTHTLILDAIDTLGTTLRGFQISKTVLLAPGKDTTISPTSAFSKCGYSGFPSCL